MKTVATILLTLVAAVPLTWYATRHFDSHTHEFDADAPPAPAPAQRKLLYYQSAMHPWIKSDKPGRCTICGMELTPVYEGETGPVGVGGDVVPLSQSMIQVLHVQTEEVQVRPLRKTLAVAGLLEEDATRHRVIAAYVPGRIDKLHVSFLGAEVTPGEPLAEFYSPSLLQAEREYRALQGDLRAATALRLRQMGLTQEQIEALPDKAGDRLTSQILAPIGGTVVAQNVYAGQYVQEGETLFEIADLSKLWFQFRAYEQDLPWLKPGLRVDIRTSSHPGRTLEGTIAFLDPTLEEATRSTKVRVELENPQVDGRPLLLLGLYADGRVHLEAPEVLTVPRTAVIQTGPEAVAYVDGGAGSYTRRKLVLGRRGDDLVEILSGLAAGEKVVINGNLLMDGQAEMNRTFAESDVSPTNPPATPTPPAASVAFPSLSEAQREVVRSFLSHADALGKALAGDSLVEFNRLAPQSAEVVATLSDAFASEAAWPFWGDPIRAAVPPVQARDIQDARRMFHPLSAATVALVQALRRSDPPFASIKVFRCPMTRDSFPGAPSRAEWMQLQPEVRNPYFGAEMLDCGAEVKP